MNYEFKEGQEVWVKGKVEDGIIIVFDEPIFKEDFPYVDIRTDLPEKPIVPQIVAEWIEKTKRTYNLYGAMRHIKDNLVPPEIMKWFSTNPTLTGEILARAWLDGYEVEKEKLYYVNIPNVYHGDFGYSETHDNYSFYNKSDSTEIRFELTESEIKLKHEWAWQWAEPVEEVE